MKLECGILVISVLLVVLLYEIEDVCADGTSGCSPDASCQVVTICTCNYGFTGDGKTCTNVCADSVSGCSPNASCQVVNGAAVCTCNDGFTGDGKTCNPIDDFCADGISGCSPNASCQVVNGTAVCTCNDGFAGDGKTCNILMQQRVEHTSSFFSRTWNEYKAGFGDETGNYWIGLERLHQLTKDGLYKLRVDVQAQSNGSWYWEEFPVFIVGDESSGYLLTIDAVNCTGTAGKGWMDAANGMKFSTKDVDNDVYLVLHCAADSRIGNGGGGWIEKCHGLYVNGITRPDSYGGYGFSWWTVPNYRLLQSRLTLVPK